MKVAKKHVCLIMMRICTILVMLNCVLTTDAGAPKLTYDVNGDGLPDMLQREGDRFAIAINTGTGFLSGADREKGAVGQSLATSVSEYGNFAVSVPIHILFLKFRLTTKTIYSASSGVTYTYDYERLKEVLYPDFS